ncbi:MAG: hypothetical protein GEU98_04295 [Pseudonocardiaceae bacterium]|nr:hypothetical protein [Pseudonocardiaceae bacterium]
MRTRRIVQASLVSAAMAGSALFVGGQASGSAPAPADKPAGPSIMDCSHDHSNKDSGEGRVDADWLRYRVGPHTSCAALGQEPRGTLIYYHCFVGDFPNSWTWGRVSGTNKQGWFADRYLSDDGARKRC